MLFSLIFHIHPCPRNQYQIRRYGRKNRRRKFFHECASETWKIEDEKVPWRRGEGKEREERAGQTFPDGA